MQKRQAEKRLADLGFAFDWEATGPTWWGWEGTIDPIGKVSIGGECRGIVVSGSTKAEMYEDAIREAQDVHHLLEPCPDPDDCDMHGDDADQ